MLGLDPVSARPRTATEVWVVNRISDTISIVDLSTMNVVKTLKSTVKDRTVNITGKMAGSAIGELLKMGD